MDAQAQAVIAGGGEDPPALGHAEDTLLAEHVGEGGQATARDLGDHLVHEQAQVALALGPVLEGDLVGAEEGGDDGDGMAGGGGADGLERAELGLGREPVAALHLRRGRALEERVVSRARTRRASPSGEARRVASTLRTMPPPASAISR